MIRHLFDFECRLPVPDAAVDFSGLWRDDNGSELELTVDGVAICGVYRTRLTGKQSLDAFPLVGFGKHDILSLTVDFGADGSLAAWVGQYALRGKRECLKTAWLLSEEVIDPNDGGYLHGTVLSGTSEFQRAP